VTFFFCNRKTHRIKTPFLGLNQVRTLVFSPNLVRIDLLLRPHFIRSLIQEVTMLTSWLSAGLLVIGGLLGCLGAYLQYNPLLAVAGTGLLAGAVISGATEWSSGR
jgi:hypothetical protein